MRFNSYYSSSKANLYTVEAASGRCMLIECGCTPKKLMKALDFKLDNIVGCLLTHEHKDHSKSVDFVLEAGIDCYMSKGTRDALVLLHRRIHLLEDRRPVKIGEFNILPFNVEHDAKDPLGFVIKTDGESLLFVTDTFMIKQRFACQFNIIALCCNYDKTILVDRVAQGNINETYAKRLLTSHMEKEVTKDYIRKFCNLNRCTQIYLLHVSGTNADRKKIAKEFEDEFFIETIAGVP